MTHAGGTTSSNGCWPPTTMLVQSFKGLSDREDTDPGGEPAMVGSSWLATGAQAFHPSVLVAMRNRLRASQRPRRLLEDNVALAKVARSARNASTSRSAHMTRAARTVPTRALTARLVPVAGPAWPLRLGAARGTRRRARWVRLSAWSRCPWPLQGSSRCRGGTPILHQAGPVQPVTSRTMRAKPPGTAQMIWHWTSGRARWARRRALAPAQSVKSRPTRSRTILVGRRPRVSVRSASSSAAPARSSSPRRTRMASSSEWTASRSGAGPARVELAIAHLRRWSAGDYPQPERERNGRERPRELAGCMAVANLAGGPTGGGATGARSPGRADLCGQIVDEGRPRRRAPASR